MSKLYAACVFSVVLLCSACTSIFGINEADPLVDHVGSGTVSDAADSGVSYIDVGNYFPDTGTPEVMPPPYVECVSSFSQPVADVCPNCSARAKKCLTAVFCIDSTGATVSNGFVDGCQAGYPMPCTFKKSCFDQNSYCLPMNDQGTGREYFGLTCNILVAFMALDQFNTPVSQYVGYDSCIDTDGGIMDHCLGSGFENLCTTTYRIGKNDPCVNGNCDLAYKQYDPDGGYVCQLDTLGLPIKGDAVFFLSAVISPNDCNEAGMGDLFHPCFVSEF